MPEDYGFLPGGYWDLGIFVDEYRVLVTMAELDALNTAMEEHGLMACAVAAPYDRQLDAFELG